MRRFDDYYLTRISRLKTATAKGFTLVELMVVIVIIGILFSLIGVAVLSALVTAKIAQTKATIVKVQGLLQQRFDAALRHDPEKQFVDSLVSRFGNRNRALSMARKYEFRKAFPQSWDEIESYNRALLVGQTFPAASARNASTQSAEVLYFILTKANVMGHPPEGADVFSSTELRDTDGNGAPEIIDAWGQPLRFYRWPTRLIRGGPYTPGADYPPGSFTPKPVARALIPALPTTASDLMHDPDDKFGLLKVNSDWSPPFPAGTNNLPATEIQYFENGNAPDNTSPFYKMGRFHTMNTTSFPLVVSGGPDMSTGLLEPTDTIGFGDQAQTDPGTLTTAYDDITNYNIRSGGN